MTGCVVSVTITVKHRMKQGGGSAEWGVGANIEQGPPLSEASPGETVCLSTDHFAGFIHKFRQGPNLNY